MVKWSFKKKSFPKWFKCIFDFPQIFHQKPAQCEWRTNSRRISGQWRRWWLLGLRTGGGPWGRGWRGRGGGLTSGKYLGTETSHRATLQALPCPEWPGRGGRSGGEPTRPGEISQALQNIAEKPEEPRKIITLVSPIISRDFLFVFCLWICRIILTLICLISLVASYSSPLQLHYNQIQHDRPGDRGWIFLIGMD